MLQDFINANNGSYLDFDGAYGAQCVDLVQFWSQKLGGPRLSGNAVDLQGQTHDGFFRWVDNTPDGVPRAGDIMVWGEYAPYGISQYGHTGVFVSGDVNQFTSFDQNWPTGAACHEVHHANYGGVLGWLQPVVLDPAPVAPQPEPAPAPVVEPDPVIVAPSEPPVEPSPAPVIDVPVTPVPTNPVPAPIVSAGKEKPNMVEKLKSRKLWVTVAGILVAVVSAIQGAVSGGSALLSVTTLVAVYTAIQGVIDHKNA